MDVKKMQLFLRVMAILLLVLTACLVSLDRQTKLVYGLAWRKATFKDVNALYVLVPVESVAAGYNLVQFGLEIFTANWLKGRTKSFDLYLNSVCLILDQVVVYIVFAATSAALEASMLAVTGSKALNWMKLCNIYTRFCYQIGGGLASGLIACFILALISSISAFTLFRLYSPKRFLVLKL